jgi:hypothetical protein
MFKQEYRLTVDELEELGRKDSEKIIALPPLSDDLRNEIDSLSLPIKQHYKTFSIPKRGRRGTRKIDAPSKELKAIQRQILGNFNSCLYTWLRPNIFGFVKGRTIADNAMYHVTELSHNKLIEFLGKHDKTIKQDHGSIFRKSSKLPSYWVNNQKIIAKKYKFVDITLAKVDLAAYKELVPKGAVRIDIKNAFSSIHSSLIRMSLKKYTNMSEEDIERIITVCTVDKGLPQGAPTSPILLNFALVDFDIYCYNLIKKKVGERFEGKLKYSRYADDIIVSSSNGALPKKCINFIRGVATLYGLELNDKKTRIMSAPTGIFINGINIVNGFDHICISRKQRSKIRAAINQAALIKDKNSLDFKNLKRQIIGRISYVNSLDKVHGTRLLKYAVEREVLDSKTKIHKMRLDLKVHATNKYVVARSKVY